MRRMRTWRSSALAAVIANSILFQGCPFAGLLDACFREDTISRSEYEDMNAFERLLYEENSCGRYGPRFDFDD